MEILAKRLDSMEPSEVHWHKLHGLDWRNKKQYDSLQKLRQRFTDDWIMIDCEDEATRDQQFAQHILSALKHCPVHPTSSGITWQSAAIPEALLNPVSKAVSDDEYKAELKKLTKKVADSLRFDNRNVSICFEGMDAAGKGGAIKRIVKNWIRANTKFIPLVRLKHLKPAVRIYGVFGQKFCLKKKSIFLTVLGMVGCWWSGSKVLVVLSNGSVPMMKSTALKKT